MTAQVVALYTHPENPADFDQKYFETHVPLINQLPGLLKNEVSKMTGNMMGGESPYYMMAVLTFENRAALDAAMKSPEGQAAAKNIMGFAAKNIALLVSESVPAGGVAASAR